MLVLWPKFSRTAVAALIFGALSFGGSQVQSRKSGRLPAPHLECSSTASVRLEGKRDNPAFLGACYSVAELGSAAQRLRPSIPSPPSGPKSPFLVLGTDPVPDLTRSSAPSSLASAQIRTLSRCLILHREEIAQSGGANRLSLVRDNFFYHAPSRAMGEPNSRCQGHLADGRTCHPGAIRAKLAPWTRRPTK